MRIVDCPSRFFSYYLNSTWRLALIAPIVLGVSVLVGYTATATAPALMRLAAAPQISESPAQPQLGQRVSYTKPSIHPLERLLLLSSAFQANVFTDKPNYQPGETAVITGSGFLPNEVITVQIVHIDGTAEGGEGHEPWNVAADSFGNFSSTWFVDPDDSAGSLFRLTAIGNGSGFLAETTFTDGSANLDTCANGPFSGPVQCTGDNWQNGNLNASKSHYFEGDSVPYRSVFDNLIPGNTYTVTIEYDTTQGGSHALDYLTSYYQTEPTPGNDPCTQKQGGSIVTICNKLTGIQTPIPGDQNVQFGLNGVLGGGDDITQLPGFFTLFNGTALSVLNLGSPYTLSGSYAGNSSTSITVQFTASTPTAVLAWAGHISTRKDWGTANSAIAINGSPYHMRLTNLTCSGVGEVCNVGNQDHQLSADAVFFPIQLTVIKETNPDDAQVKTFNYTTTGTNLGPFSLTPPNGITPAQTIFNLNDATARSVTESDPHAAAPQFDLTGLSCTQTDGGLGIGSLTTSVGTRTVSFTPHEGQFISCTFTNTEDLNATRGKIIVDKVTNPSGDTTSFNFTSTYGSPFSLTDAATPNDSGLIMPGTYSVSETANSAYVTTATCTSSLGHPADDPSSINLAAGEVVTCTFTNAKKPKLTVTKVVVNDNGGTKVVADFPLFVDLGSVTSGVQNTFGVGAHSVSETTDPNYTSTISGDCASDGSITLAAGDVKACTITNDDKPAHLIIIKQVTNDNGGTAVAGDFSGAITGVTASGGNTWTGTVAPGVDKTLTTIGAYNVTENAFTGYTPSFSTDCSGTIALGQTKTCTVTNNDNAAHLIIIKQVTNDNGGTAVAGDFSGSITGVTASGGNTWTGTVAPGVDKTLTTIGAYNVTENAFTGYTPSFSTDCSGTIALGQTKTCTVTNNDNAAHLIIIKQVTNDNGGTAVAGDFSGAITGVTASGGNTWTGTVAPGVDKTLTTVGGYNVTENAFTGYTPSYSADCSGTIALGQTKTCTVTNNDNAAHLVIIKQVTNDNGGTAVAGDFSGAITGVTASGGNTWIGTVAPGVDKTLTTIGAYNVTENAFTGYTPSFSTDCSGTIALGQTKTCTVTNNDNAAHLIIIKQVTNDNGGTAVAGDFSGAITGVTASGGNTWTGTVAPGVDKTLTTVGGYNVTENAFTGYTPSYSADCNGTIALGQTKTCTVTNNDNAAHLIIIKQVTNDNGGTAVAGDFSGAITGVTASGGNTWTGTVAPGVDKTLTTVGGYNVTENAFTGYTPSFSADCSGTIALGQTKTCTVTNNDNAAHLIIIKQVTNDNGGTAVAGDFSGAITGVTASGGNTWTGTVAPGVDKTLTTVGGYNVTENAFTGYTPSYSTDCSGTIALGQTKTCTVTNNDNAAHLIIIKQVTNDNGGTAVAGDFSGSITGVTASGGNTWTGTVAPGVNKTLTTIGAYNVTENAFAGYAASFSTDCSGTIALGQTKTCTVTNNDIAPTLRIIKDIVPDSDTGLFNLRIDGATAGTGANVGDNGTTGSVPVNAGNHTVSETAGTATTLSDYVSVIGGDCAASGAVSLALAQNKTCTITNTKKGMAQVIKTFNGGALGANSFTFQLRSGASAGAAGTILESGTANAGNSGIINFATKLLPATTYQMCEQMQPGWLTTLGPPLYSVFNPSGDNSVVCTDFTVTPGQTKVFTINNQPPPGGMGLTIGFWKNWSSCAKSNGAQKPTLDRTLQLGDLTLGTLLLHDTNPNPDVASDCQAAVNLLNKMDISGSNKKLASDPIFNMVAQLVAADLNVLSGAGLSINAMSVRSCAHALLVTIAFNGTTYNKPLSATLTTQANCLATQLDRYNNNLSVGTCTGCP